jgi:hypothetical protein
MPDALAVNVRLLNVFAPPSARVPAEVLVKDTLWNVTPPPLMMAVDAVMFICDVPALKLRLVGLVVSQAVPVEDKVTVLDPSVINLRKLVSDNSAPAVTLKFAVSNVPLVIVRVLVLMFNASPSVTVPLTALIVTPLNVLPAVISVPAPMIVIVPVWV